MENNECMITTSDNPYDYFTQFNEWFMFDIEHGYNTCSFLARIANLNDQMSDAEVSKEIERACDEIMKFNITGNYIKITKKQATVEA